MRAVPGCTLVPEAPCEGESSGGSSGDNGGSGDGQCWVEEEPTQTCMAVPEDCQQPTLVTCLETGALCPNGGSFDAGTLACEYNPVDHCEEGESGHLHCRSC